MNSKCRKTQVQLSNAAGACLETSPCNNQRGEKVLKLPSKEKSDRPDRPALRKRLITYSRDRSTSAPHRGRGTVKCAGVDAEFRLREEGEEEEGGRERVVCRRAT